MAGLNGKVQHLPTSPTSTERAVRFIRSKLQRGFYGSITIKIQDGSVTHLLEERGYLGDQIPQPETQASTDTMP